MRFLTPYTDNLTNFYDKVRYIIVWRLILLSIIVFFSLALIFSQIHFQAFIVYTIVFCLSVITAIYIKSSGNFLFAYWVFTFSASALVTYSMNYIVDTLHYSDIFWIIAIILFAFIGLGKKWALGFITFHALSLVYFIGFKFNGHVEYLRPLNMTEKIGVSIEIVFGLIVISYLFKLYFDFKDHSEKELQNVNAELEKQNKIVISKNVENITLVQEIHHRVKNNLQIVISLLRIQSKNLESADTKIQFSEAINRIMAISLIHEKLYQENELSKIQFHDYFTELISEIKLLYDMNIDFQLSFNSLEKEIGLKSIVPLGLLLNELITNSIKHAFVDSENGVITIFFSFTDKENIILEYADNGTWKSENESGINFGSELIKILTEQMEGTYNRTKSNYRFSLKNIDYL